VRWVVVFANQHAHSLIPARQICTDLLFDPITFLDCLHTNCGSCSKSWFSSQATNRNPAPTCPVCREPVRETRPNAAFASLLEDYLRNNPDKRRSEDDVRAARAIFKPGEQIVSGGAVVNGAAPAAAAPPVAPRRPSQQQRAAPIHPHMLISLDPFASPLSPNARENFLGQGFGFSDPPQRLFQQFFSGFGQQQQQQQQQQTRGDGGGFLRGSPPQVSPRPNFNYTRRLPNQPNTVADIITLTRRTAEISCDSCTRNINTAVHYECMTCCLYHVCAPCYHSGIRCPMRHPMVGQKQKTGFPMPYLETGLFCNVCEEWVDAPGGNIYTRGQNSYFWRCAGGCNVGSWLYCMRCVRLGNCCDHELKLYTNNRAPTSANAMIRGPSQQSQQGTSLEARGYTRHRDYQVTCDHCGIGVLNGGAGWYHCRECMDGEFDICMNCAEWLPQEGACLRGHRMAIISQGSEGRGDMRTLLKPEIEAPELCGNAEPRTAIALTGNLAGIRSEAVLRFPVGAELSNVRPALDDDEWCWGTYCGRGGIFEKRLVRFV
jgi:hypothetical protein